MSAINALKVIQLAAINPTFRAAFKADQDQALTLFSANLNLEGTPALTHQEMQGILSVTDDEYTAFSRIATAVGAQLDPRAGVLVGPIGVGIL
jgi:hypothetical protein